MWGKMLMWSKMPDDKRRVLILGGLHSDIPRWMFRKFRVQHIERYRGVIKIDYQPDLILIFIRFASHNLYGAASSLAKDNGIPLLAATNYSDAIKLAQRHGLDWFVNTAIEARRTPNVER